MVDEANQRDEQVEAAVRRAVDLYAESYMAMSRTGDGRVECSDVAYDLRRNVTDSILASLANRPADDGGWIAWEPEENPARGKMVEYRLRNGDVGFDHADIIQWSHCGDRYDVVAYRTLPMPLQPEGVKRP